jgi:hypothetical protein
MTLPGYVSGIVKRGNGEVVRFATIKIALVQGGIPDHKVATSNSSGGYMFGEDSGMKIWVMTAQKDGKTGYCANVPFTVPVNDVLYRDIIIP